MILRLVRYQQPPCLTAAPLSVWPVARHPEGDVHAALLVRRRDLPLSVLSRGFRNEMCFKMSPLGLVSK